MCKLLNSLFSKTKPVISYEEIARQDYGNDVYFAAGCVFNHPKEDMYIELRDSNGREFTLELTLPEAISLAAVITHTTHQITQNNRGE